MAKKRYIFGNIGSWAMHPFDRDARLASRSEMSMNSYLEDNPIGNDNGYVPQFNNINSNNITWASPSTGTSSLTSSPQANTAVANPDVQAAGTVINTALGGVGSNQKGFTENLGGGNDGGGNKFLSFMNQGGGGWTGAIAPAATNIANALMDTEASTAERVATAMGMPALAKVWTADTTKGDAVIKSAQENLANYGKQNFIQDAGSAAGAGSAVKLNNKQVIPMPNLTPNNLTWKDFRGNMFTKGAAATLQGAAAGSVGGPWGALGGAVTGLLGSLFGGIGAKKRAKRAYADYQRKLGTVNSAQQYAYNTAVANQQLSNMQALANGNSQQKISDMANISAYGGNLYTDLSPNMMNMWNNKQNIDQQKVMNQQMNFGLGNSFNQKMNMFPDGGWMDYIDLSKYYKPNPITLGDDVYLNDEALDKVIQKYRNHEVILPFNDELLYADAMETMPRGILDGKGRYDYIQNYVRERRKEREERKRKADEEFRDRYHDDWGERTPEFGNMSDEEFDRFYNNPDDPIRYGEYRPEEYNQYKYRLFQRYPNKSTLGNSYLFKPSDDVLKKDYPEKDLPVYRDRNGNLYLKRGIQDLYGNNKSYSEYDENDRTHNRRNKTGDLRITPDYNEWRAAQAKGVPHEKWSDFKKQTEERLLNDLRYRAFENNLYLQQEKDAKKEKEDEKKNKIDIMEAVRYADNYMADLVRRSKDIPSSKAAASANKTTSGRIITEPEELHEIFAQQLAQQAERGGDELLNPIVRRYGDGKKEMWYRGKDEYGNPAYTDESGRWTFYDDDIKYWLESGIAYDPNNYTKWTENYNKNGFYELEGYPEEKSDKKESSQIPDDFMSNPVVEHDEIVVTPKTEKSKKSDKPSKTSNDQTITQGQRGYNELQYLLGKKEDVERFQRNAGIKVDGKVGRQTTTALQKMLNEQGYNLEEDGIFGDKTRAAYNDYISKLYADEKRLDTDYQEFAYGGNLDPIDPPKTTETPNSTAVNIADTTHVPQIDPYSQALLDGYTPSEYYINKTNEEINKINEQTKKDIKTTVNMMYGDRYGEADYNNRYAGGGEMSQSDLPDNMQYYANGGTHEENPYGGIQVGVDGQGKPNLVEEGEFRWGDFVFSDRIMVDPAILSDFNLSAATRHQNKKAGKGKLSFADMAKKYAKKYKELENDPISKNSLNDYMDKLSKAQEYQKAAEQLEAQKQNELQDYKTALNKQNNNPMYGNMKYSGMGNAATQQGVNEGVDAGMGNPMANADLSNVNRSGNAMMAAYGGNLYWNGSWLKGLLGKRKPVWPPNNNSRADYAMDMIGNPTIPPANGNSRIDYANQFMQPSGSVDNTQNQINDFFDRIYSGNVGYGSPKQHQDNSVNTYNPSDFNDWYAVQHQNGTMPYTPKVSGRTGELVGNNGNPVDWNNPLGFDYPKGQEADYTYAPAGDNASTGRTTLIDYDNVGKAGAINTGSTGNGESNPHSGLLKTEPGGVYEGLPKEYDIYNTAGEWAQTGKGITPLLYDWANKTNVKYDPDYIDENRIEALANAGPALRTADAIGGYRAPNLLDVERTNNIAQAQGLAALMGTYNIANGNRGFVNLHAAQNAYNTQMGIGDNRLKAQRANNEERYKTDVYNNQIDQFNANARNSMYQDNQREQEAQMQRAVNGAISANQQRQYETLYADRVNDERMNNRASNMAAFTDNYLNFIADKAKENKLLNAKNADITNPYWTDKDGRMHYIGDTGLERKVREKFGNDMWFNSGTVYDEFNKLREKYGDKTLAQHPELWEHLVEMEKKAQTEAKAKSDKEQLEAKRAKAAGLELALQRYADLQNLDGNLYNDNYYNKINNTMKGWQDWAVDDSRWGILSEYARDLDNEYSIARKNYKEPTAKAYGGKLNKRKKNDYTIII